MTNSEHHPAAQPTRCQAVRSAHSVGHVSGPRRAALAIFQSGKSVFTALLTGDLSHLAAIIILLLKIWKSRSCAGISGKSQILFALVFTTRYLDLLTSFISLYNTIMKVIYIACAYATVYLIYAKFKATYDGNHDTFRVEFLVVPVGGLAFLVNHDFSPLEILWTFSIYLESVSILPQLFMISKTGEAETITTHYLFFLGLYRALYLINWIWRFYFESFFDMIAIVAGIVQTIFVERKEAESASLSLKERSARSGTGRRGRVRCLRRSAKKEIQSCSHQVLWNSSGPKPWPNHGFTTSSDSCFMHLVLPFFIILYQKVFYMKRVL
ncbi:ER lumen protein-retaining receptor 2 [Labeo rohita]|uniref:ER lumen protein-retaining receptor 2 n=1 Tax=Labeo rohita TaxID=84645 RepID=A0ABQ8M877_LABRO|nr:ER lumen protein-retaining receptor 2 [Labeo rohita]